MLTCRGANGEVKLSDNGSLRVSTVERSSTLTLDGLTTVQVRRKSIMPPSAIATVIAVSLGAEQIIMMGWLSSPVGWNELVLIQQVLLGLLALALFGVLIRALFAELIITHTGLQSAFALSLVPVGKARRLAGELRTMRATPGS
jgi:hypothetical protein